MNKAFIEKYNMLPRGSGVLCAVSGGKDSMYLLCRMLELSDELELAVSCAHFDHRLRGEESDRDREFVRSFCEKRGVPFYAGSGAVADYAAENGLGIEEAARLLRYRFLEDTADRIGAERIATAHTADDNAETVLLNLLRGTGLRGLCGIPPVRGRIIRPMLELTSAEVLDYLDKNGIPHMEDSTNASDDYSRNRLRHRVLPELRELNPAFLQNVSRASGYLREDEEYLSGAAESFIAEHFKDNSLPVRELAGLPRPVSARVLQNICGGALSSQQLEALREIAAGKAPHAAADVSGGRVTREYDRLLFGAQTPPTLPVRTLVPGGETVIFEAGLTIRTEIIEKCSEIHNSFNTFFFKNDSICGNITVESRKAGESLRISGRGCTKTLKKLFSEARLNGCDKNLVPVLYDERGAIAVYGLGLAERCAALPGDTVIKTEILPLQTDKGFDEH